MKYCIKLLLFSSFTVALTNNLSAQNPLIRNMYSADPSARVFGDSVYVYPSHDILATSGHGRIGWFCMADYHVFASKNLTDWKDDGIVVSQTTVPWTKPDAYSMWAPDCIYRNGKYYFYFPAPPKDMRLGRGFAIGVAIADKPSGPFIPQAEPIEGVHGIDPNVFIDKDGQAYLYFALGNIYGVKLKSNMLEPDGEIKTLGTLPDKGLKEGPFLFERKGIYYLTYPHVENKTERLEYAMSDNPLGPFKVTGVLMDEIPGCWTNHQSVIQYNDQWYLFYHHNDLSPNFDKARSIRADSLFFNADGTIKKVIPTLRGIGVTNAISQIQIDRYTAKADEGVIVDFMDTSNRFNGWKTTFSKSNAWIQYNTVDFGKKKLKSVVIRAIAESGGTLKIHVKSIEGPVVAEVIIPKSNKWKLIKARLLKFEGGLQDLFIVSGDNNQIAVDWIKFQ
ncbi:MAG TPA: family 43 glycosylhydrolase [Hanamia sp.]|nr:family 43 glycosylhydrolase [Hanamia sp.]